MPISRRQNLTQKVCFSVKFYTACIRSVLTYAAPVFSYALPKYLKDELVRVEKRSMFITCPGLPYQETFELVNIVPIVDSITGQSSNTFDTITKDPKHRLNNLIPFIGPSRYALRCNRRFIVPKCKTDRFSNSLIIRSCIDNIYVDFQSFNHIFYSLIFTALSSISLDILSIPSFVSTQFSLRAKKYLQLNYSSIFYLSKQELSRGNETPGLSAGKV